MTIKGNTTIPIIGYCPDRWCYKFDGEIITLTEEWDEVPEDAIAYTIECLKRTMNNVSRDSNSITANKKVTQLQAIAVLVGEAISQSHIANISSSKVRDGVMREIIDYFEMNSKPVSIMSTIIINNSQKKC